MTDDFFDPKNQTQDYHSVEQVGFQAANKEYIEPPNIKNLIYRLPELWTDPNCNQLSSSRLGLCFVNVTGAMVVIMAAWAGNFEVAGSVLIPLAATDAGVYFASTVKDWRWRRERHD